MIAAESDFDLPDIVEGPLADHDVQEESLAGGHDPICRLVGILDLLIESIKTAHGPQSRHGGRVRQAGVWATWGWRP